MFSYQQNLFAPVLPCSREVFFNIVKSEKVISVCGVVTSLKIKEMQTQDEAERKRLHEEQSRMKKQLPAFIFQASFPGGRRKQADARLNGLVMLDFDGVGNPKATVKEWTEKGIIEKHGVMLVHVTPSGMGLRVVAKADIGTGNLADNQAALAAALGLQEDKACKDASRISFAVPQDYILYLNDKIFDYENKEFDARFGDCYRSGDSSNTHDMALSGGTRVVESDGGSSVDGDNTATQDPRGSEPSGGKGRVLAQLPRDEEGNPTFKGVAYKRIIGEWWKRQGGAPVVGERNQKLHRLAAHLRYICDNDVETLIGVMPKFGLSDAEMRSLCESACKLRNYGSLPKALAEVLEALSVDMSEDEENAADLRNLDAEYLERLNALKLPHEFEILMKLVPENVKIGVLLASLPMMYTLATRVTFRHFDGTMTRLSGMAFVIGAAASGKSFILTLDKMLMEPIRMADKAGRKTEQEYRDSKELNKNKQKQMEKPHPVIRITPIQISNTMLALRMRDAVDNVDPSLHLHVYSCEAELATALRAQRGGSWIEKNDIYCKSFHNEYWGMDYANDQAVNGEIEVNLNLVVSGTEDAFDKLIPTSSVLSGLPTRLMYFAMPENHFTMIGKAKKLISDSEKKEITELAYYLDQTRGELRAEKLTDYMYKWCERMAKRAEMEEDIELDDLRKRTAIIGERAGIVYALVAQRADIEKGKPISFNKDVLDFAEFIADYCLFSQYRKFAQRMKEQKQRVEENAGVRRQPMKIVDLYNSLPKSFSYEELAKLRNTNNGSTIRMLAKRWKDHGLIVKTGTNTFKKIITKI